jgi:RNA 3'-terminal phosphate cyclase (GTP)
MLEITGDYLEGGGQILRTAISLSCITGQPIRVFNIRTKRKTPGLKSQHLYTLKTLASLFKAETKGLELGSKEVIFSPQEKFIPEKFVEIDLKTSGAIGLALQTLILVCAFRSQGITLLLKGGTSGLGAVPVDYYKEVVFPILLRSGLNAKLKILKRGYYPKGGGEVKVEIEPLKEPKGIFLTDPGKITGIKIMSIASSQLAQRQVTERQAKSAEKILSEKYPVPIKSEIEYAKTLSVGTEINLVAYTKNNCILWSDVRGERGKLAEKVGQEAAEKLIKEIDSGAACDFHLADNLIPWLSLLGGSIKTSKISLHTETNIWICELFFGKIFEIKDTTITKVSP